jgi:L-ribulose-5-phosphate 3-epimerase
MKSPFQIAVINDELTQDFGRACEIVAGEFHLEWIEIRSIWNKNLLKLDAREITEARRILERNPAKMIATGRSWAVA